MFNLFKNISVMAGVLWVCLYLVFCWIDFDILNPVQFFIDAPTNTELRVYMMVAAVLFIFFAVPASFEYEQYNKNNSDIQATKEPNKGIDNLIDDKLRAEALHYSIYGSGYGDGYESGKGSGLYK